MIVDISLEGGTDILSEDKMSQEKYHTDKMSPEKLPHRRNVTCSKCHGTKYYVNKMSQDLRKINLVYLSRCSGSGFDVLFNYSTRILCCDILSTWNFVL